MTTRKVRRFFLPRSTNQTATVCSTFSVICISLPEMFIQVSLLVALLSISREHSTRVCNFSQRYLFPATDETVFQPTMILLIFKNGCFWFEVIIAFMLLTFALYSYHTQRNLAVCVSFLVAFLLAFIFVISISSLLPYGIWVLLLVDFPLAIFVITIIGTSGSTTAVPPLSALGTPRWTRSSPQSPHRLTQSSSTSTGHLSLNEPTMLAMLNARYPSPYSQSQEKRAISN